MGKQGFRWLWQCNPEQGFVLHSPPSSGDGAAPALFADSVNRKHAALRAIIEPCNVH
jgi:hypothetical protein